MYHVVIVEDEFFVRLGIKNSISWEQLNMQVVSDVGTGAQAWEIIRRDCPDILITDLLMPDMNGQQLIERIREAGLEPYIIVITCLEEFKTLQKMMSLGIRDYLLKATMTEQEIHASLERAVQELKKREAPHSLSHPLSQSENIARTLYAWFSEPALYGQVCQMLSEEQVQQERAATLILGQIDTVLDLQTEPVPVPSDHLCKNLIDMAKHILPPDFRFISLCLDAEHFLMFLFPLRMDSSRQIPSIELMQKLQKDLQDYLNIRLSLFIDSTSQIVELPVCFQALRTLQEQHYLQGRGAFLIAKDYIPPRIAELCAPLASYLDWFENDLGATAAKRFRDCLKNIVSCSEKSCQEMLYSLFQLSHLIGDYFDNALEKDRQICEQTILNFPYLPDGLAALETFIQTCEQYSLEHGNTQYRPEIRAALKIIHQNLGNPELSLGSVAKQIGLSETYFSSLFHSQLKQPFRRYLILARIEEAKYLLENSESKIWDIAARTGFADEGYFSKVFKKVTQISPKEWRKQ